MNFDQLDQQLRETVTDLRLSDSERNELRQLGQIIDAEHIRFLRNRAFAMVREIMQQNTQPEDLFQALKWLEQVIKTLDFSATGQKTKATAQFSPGESCRQKIIQLCQQAMHSIDVCVFTISDDRLSNSLIECHKRGVPVRIITDSEKQYDSGSDIQDLRDSGVPLRIDNTEFHMHHKFALFDGKILLNGSFNWTLSASMHNQENLLTTDDPTLVKQYTKQFNTLWQRYA